MKNPEVHRIRFASAHPETSARCAHRKFGWLRSEPKLFMQKKFKVAGARFEPTTLRQPGGCGYAATEFSSEVSIREVFASGTSRPRSSTKSKNHT
jgi:hypothetical protein